MKHKNYVYASIIMTLALLVPCMLIVMHIDPFMQYHKPMKQRSYQLDTEHYAYINPGIAKHYDYDTVIMGSSMSRSFLPSHIDEVYDAQTVKLSMAEARGADLREMLKVVEKNKKLKRVIIGLDAFAFNVDKDFSSYEMPLYLYDDFVLNDLPYLLNLDNLVECASIIKDTEKKIPSTTMDEYQNYALSAVFGKEEVIRIYNEKYSEKKCFDENSEKEEKVIIENLSCNLLPFIENHPEVEFLFYFPPYSIARWGLEPAPFKTLGAMKLITEQLLPYKNVKLYFYQGHTDVVLNLDRYMDTIHFDSGIANDIIDSMYAQEDLLTAQNYEQYFARFRDFIASYPYETLLLQEKKE